LIDEHLTALGGFGYAQRPPTLVELYADGPFINYLQQGLTRVVGDPHLVPPTIKQMDIGVKGNYNWFRGGATRFMPGWTTTSRSTRSRIRRRSM